MVNEGGCPYNVAGIGDISYVKNLITEEISSNDFSCSVFGAYSYPSAMIGWVSQLNNYNNSSNEWNIPEALFVTSKDEYLPIKNCFVFEGIDFQYFWQWEF